MRREFVEELAADLTSVELLAVSENIFDILGEPGHEIVHIFAVRCPELESLPRDERRPVLDGSGTVGWYPVAAFAEGQVPLYPAGALDAARRMLTT